MKQCNHSVSHDRGPFTPVAGHHLYAPALTSDSIVLDVGAHKGGFARALIKRFGCTPYMVEANPNLVADLRKEFGTRLQSCAVAAKCEMLEFHIAENDIGSSVLDLPDQSQYNCVHQTTVEVQGRPLSWVFDQFDLLRLDLVKLNIEGAEVEILESVDDDALGLIDQLSVAFHTHPQFGFKLQGRDEAIVTRLRGLGFLDIDFTYPKRVDVLFLHPSRLGLSAARVAWWRRRYAQWPRLYGNIRHKIRTRIAGAR